MMLYLPNAQYRYIRIVYLLLPFYIHIYVQLRAKLWVQGHGQRILFWCIWSISGD